MKAKQGAGVKQTTRTSSKPYKVNLQLDRYS